MRQPFPWFAFFLAICPIASGQDDPGDAPLGVESFRERKVVLDRQYRKAISELANQVESYDLVGSRWLRRWLPSPPAYGESLFVATDIYSPPVDIASDLDDLPPWHAPWHALRVDWANQYQRLAIEACEQEHVGLAMQFATHAVRENSHQKKSRLLLGYQPVKKSWGGYYAARMSKSGRNWNSKYGWVRVQDLEQWNAGLRPLGKQWISLAQDKKRHATIEKGWHIRTDHYEIVTNHSRAAGIAMAEKLERVYQVWQQLFGDYFMTSRQLLQRVEGKGGPGHSRKPFQVRYYRSRDQYNEHLRRLQPRIGRTLGIYFDTLRQSHFFYGPEQDAGTLYHEGVHQLFQESRGAARKRITNQVAFQANAWVIEGVACYFESLTGHSLKANGGEDQQKDLLPGGHRDKDVAESHPSSPDYFTVGTPNAGRLRAARHRFLVDAYYLPLKEFCALGAQDLQRHEHIARLYSQAAGVATFLIHYQGGLYRQSFVRYLQTVYAGRDNATTLSDVTGQPMERLDKQYANFLERLP